MIRREEIYEASCECYNDYIDVVNVDADAAQDAFIKGAEWADKTMIDKVCEWIEDNAENTFVCVNGTMTELKGIELSRYIRKAMEE